MVIDDTVGAHYDRPAVAEDELPDDSLRSLKDYWNRVLWDIDKME